MNNHELIYSGLRQLREVLAPYVCATLRAEYGENWWPEAVLAYAVEDQKLDLPQEGSEEELAACLDMPTCLRLLDFHWNAIFRKKLPRDCRSWARELASNRNGISLLERQEIADDDVWRILDTMGRICEPLASGAAEEIRSLLREARYGSRQGSMATQPGKEQPALQFSDANLPSWRAIMQPHPDVAEGRYKNAEFAADLAQVSRGEGGLEYRDPVEFFSRTYLTEGMKGLLISALKRVAGKGGDPVIQLKTAFGGGKTHTMLALYHLLRGNAPLDRLAGIAQVLEQAGLDNPPKTHVATIVGTALNHAGKGWRPANLPGVTVRTIWGEIAYQIAVSAGNPELYDLIKEADAAGISPGSEALKELFNEAGSCLVLMDELVAYARKIWEGPKSQDGREGKRPATNAYENFLVFIQEITEAAAKSDSSLVVASIPESEIEIGGEAGQRALAAIEHTFGRMEAIWKPVAGREGFEVVRRRLFLDCHNPEARDAVCAAFSSMYAANPTEFPLASREAEYRERLAACYPVHPEVFDRLYEDWATLERFQRTRGVLRLMAAVIHELWMSNDKNALILPGSLPLDRPSVRDELLRHVSESWSAIVDKEVDGQGSRPFQLDRVNNRYGKYQAARRLSRAIMLGSAPSVREQRTRGIEAGRIRLGAILPGDDISIFNDALSALRKDLHYLYSNQTDDCFWFDTRPTLRKVAEERAGKYRQDEIRDELVRRLRLLPKKAVPPLAGVHVCPSSPQDVPDERVCRLVILGPDAAWSGKPETSPGLKIVSSLLEERGSGPRVYRNMLVFLAPDRTALHGIEEDARQFLAWQSIENDRETLNLDAAQLREISKNLVKCEEDIARAMQNAWRWLLAPNVDSGDMKKTGWSAWELKGREDSLPGRAAARLAHEDLAISRWAPRLLQMQLDELLWQGAEHLEVGRLRDMLATYCYLPRLMNYAVLERTIAEGVANDFFGYAEAQGEAGYAGLCLGQTPQVHESGLLVKKDVAVAQLDAEARRARIPLRKLHECEAANCGGDQPGTGGRDGEPGGAGSEPQAEARPTRFYLSANLELARINRDVARIVDELLNHLGQEGRLEIRLEAQAYAPEGFEPQTERTINENCRALRIGDFGFEAE